MTSSKHYDVIILGAGMAGISAAHYLASKSSGGAQIRIGLIEAQDRCGGRIQTIDLGQGYVELGASVVHGSNQANAVFNLASSYDLVESMTTSAGVGTILHSSGIAVDQSIAGELLFHLNATQFKLHKRNASNFVTLDQQIENKANELKSTYPDEVHPLIDSAVFHCKRNCSLFGGDSCHLLSAWGFSAGVDIAGDVLIRGGYRSLLNRMISDLGDKVDILLKEEVLCIDWSRPVIQVHTTKCHYICDYALVTFPLGVLKKSHQTLFTPQLPKQNVRGIESVGFGRVAKMYLQYDQPFWQPGRLNLKFFPDKADKAKILQSGNELINVIYSLEEVSTSRNVLIAWATGEDSVFIEQSSEQTLANKITDLLRLYTSDLSIPLPTRVLTSQWNSNRFIRGFKSYPSTETAYRSDFAQIGTPLSIEAKQRVFFAGEATHEYYFGTVHGARLSGLNSAEQIRALLSEAK